MKTLYFSLLCFFASLQTQAQTTIQLEMHHLFDGAYLAFNETVSNNLGNTIQFDRLEYYMDSIVLVHDGGTATLLENTYLLNAFTQIETLNLGEMEITSLESIQFSIGVRESRNHLDPTLYESLHPLALKSPSMHWGWSAGYRFAAIEGTCGDNNQYDMELHTLGDENFHFSTIETSGSLENNVLIIAVNAEYSFLIQDLSLNSNVVFHGENFPVNIEVMNMFRDNVFTVRVGEVSLTEESVAPFEIVMLHNEILLSSLDLEGTVEVYNSMGKQMYTCAQCTTIPTGTWEPGYYVVRFIGNEQIYSSSFILK